MKELIKITEQNGQQVVSARELYGFLGFERANWVRWAKQNISKSPFAIENEDWQGFVLMMNGNETTDYALTLDFAKRLAMLARTEKGEAARRYFVDCEKKLKQVTAQRLPQTYAEALRMLADEAEAKEAIVRQLEAVKPKVDFYDSVTQSPDAIDMASVAKVLNMGIGRNKLFELLRDEGVLMNNNQPYQRCIDSVYFRVIETNWTKTKGTVNFRLKTVVKEKGIEVIRNSIGQVGGRPRKTLNYNNLKQ